MSSTVTEDCYDDPQLLELLRLNLVPGIGPRLQTVLLEAFETPEGIFAASEAKLRSVDGIGPKLASAIAGCRNSSDAEEELARCHELNVKLLRRDAAGYPRMLSEVGDAPRVLYCRGAMLPQDEIAIAIVGSRHCSAYGRRQAERFATGLARAGVTIVSGLARGIDGVSHRAALEAGGRTIAVAATGLSIVYPPEHSELADEIVARGAVVSESSLAQQPVAGLFPQRNRIISGLSLGVLLVEATRNSGALHTARHAMEQGREVFALPGHVDSLQSEGCHDLIRDGVPLVRSVDDILETLGPLLGPVTTASGGIVQSPRELNLGEQEKAILNLTNSEPRHLDEIVREAGMESSRVLATLTVLEMKRLIRRLPGGQIARLPY